MSVIGPGTWRENAFRRIKALHDAHPDATAEELRKLLRKASGDFHGGTSWGKKVWPSACTQYLVRHFGAAGVPQRRVEDSPLFGPDIVFPWKGESGSAPVDTPDRDGKQ